MQIILFHSHSCSWQDCYSVGRTDIWVKYFCIKGKKFFFWVTVKSLYSICDVHVRENFLTLKWYSDRKFFGDGGGGVVGLRKFIILSVVGGLLFFGIHVKWGH